jgi:hypothetical protein
MNTFTCTAYPFEKELFTSICGQVTNFYFRQKSLEMNISVFWNITECHPWKVN